MDTRSSSAEIEGVVQEIDRLIAEMADLRRRVAALGKPSAEARRSVREAAYFGMWADRADMSGRTSRDWLEDLRAQQWSRPWPGNCWIRHGQRTSVCHDPPIGGQTALLNPLGHA